MKRFILALIFVAAGLMAYGQLSVDSAYTTSSDDLLETVGGGIFGGESKASAYLKINAIIDTLHTFYVVDTVAATVDSASISGVLGIGPAQAVGKRWYIKDATGNKNFYIVISDGEEWFIDSLKTL